MKRLFDLMAAVIAAQAFLFARQGGLEKGNRQCTT